MCKTYHVREIPPDESVPPFLLLYVDGRRAENGSLVKTFGRRSMCPARNNHGMHHMAEDG